MINEVQILLYKYCYIYAMQCALFSHQKLCLKISDTLFEFKSKDKYERKTLKKL